MNRPISKQLLLITASLGLAGTEEIDPLLAHGSSLRQRMPGRGPGTLRSRARNSAAA